MQRRMRQMDLGFRRELVPQRVQPDYLKSFRQRYEAGVHDKVLSILRREYPNSTSVKQLRNNGCSNDEIAFALRDLGLLGVIRITNSKKWGRCVYLRGDSFKRTGDAYEPQITARVPGGVGQ